MNKYKLNILRILDLFIRSWGLIGSAIFAIIGITQGWWNGEVGSIIYAGSFVLSLLYCEAYNGSEWAV